MGERSEEGGEPFLVSISGPSLVSSNVRDNGDGTYTVEHKAQASGTYRVTVTLHGAAVAQSPFTLAVHAARPDATQCVLTGHGLRWAVARHPAVAPVQNGRPTEELGLASGLFVLTR